MNLFTVIQHRALHARDARHSDENTQGQGYNAPYPQFDVENDSALVAHHANQIRDMQCAHKMDLLALLSRHQVTIHLPHDTPGFAPYEVQWSPPLLKHPNFLRVTLGQLVWRPMDSRMIAVGSSDGHVKLHDVESGERVSEFQMKPIGRRGIECLHWTCAALANGVGLAADGSPTKHALRYGVANVVQESEMRVMRFTLPILEVPDLQQMQRQSTLQIDDQDILGDLSMAASSTYHHPLLLPTAARDERSDDEDSSQQHEAELTVLCSATSDTVELRAYGAVLIGKMEMKSIEDGSLSVESASITSDLERLIVVAHRRSNSSIDRFLCIIDTSSSIARKATQISVISHHLANLQFLVHDQMDKVMNHVHRAWMSFYHQNFLVLLEDLYDMTKNVNPLDPPSGAFIDERIKFQKATNILLMYLSIGTVDDKTSKWFIESMTEQKMIRTLVQMDQTRRAISSYVLDHFQRHLENILFRLTELGGYAKWREQYETLVICEEHINALIDEADNMLHLSEQFLRDMNATYKQARNFIDWIREVSARIEGITQEEQLIRQQQMPSGPVDLMEISKFLQRLPDDHFEVMDSWKTIKLDVYPQFFKQLQELMDRTHAAVSKQFKLRHMIPLVNSHMKSVQKPACADGNEDDNDDDDDDDGEDEHFSSSNVIVSPYSQTGTQQVCFVNGADKKQIVVIEFDTRDEEQNTLSPSLVSSTTDNRDSIMPLELRYRILQTASRIDNVKFYDHNTLLCFVTDSEGQHIFGLAPISNSEGMEVSDDGDDPMQSIEIVDRQLLQKGTNLSELLSQGGAQGVRPLNVTRYQLYDNSINIMSCNHRRGLAALYSRDHKMISLYDLDTLEEEEEEEEEDINDDEV